MKPILRPSTNFPVCEVDLKLLLLLQQDGDPDKGCPRAMLKDKTDKTCQKYILDM